MRTELIVGVSNQPYSHCLRLELDDERGCFSMCSTEFRFDTERSLIECEREHMEEEYADELASTQYVRRFAPADPDFTDDEVREQLVDVSHWFDLGGVEWGAEDTGGGQRCDRWELFIPLYWKEYEPVPLDGHDFRTQPGEGADVLWFIEPREYADLLALWRAHHLERGRLFTRIPLWVSKLNTPTMDAAFRNWHRRYASTCHEP